MAILVSTVITSVLRDLGEATPASPTFWSRDEIMEWIWEGLVEMNLIAAYLKESSNVTLNRNAIQGAPAHIAITHMRIGTAALEKYSLDDLDSRAPEWENQSHAANPSKWAPVGVTLFATNKRTTTASVTAVCDVLSLPAVLTEATTLPLDDEYVEAIESYAFHVARLKEGGLEFEQSLENYQQYLKISGELAERFEWKNAPNWAVAPKIDLSRVVPRRS